MLIPDINILVYAYDADSSHHERARAWWETTLSGPRPVGLPWAVILGFIRVTTHRRVLRSPLNPRDCVKIVQTWLDHPRVQIMIPGEQHAALLLGLLTQLGIAGDLTTDAHLAALAMEYQAELVSTDADFARFPKLRWLNPLK
jgi:uncharacterized protein